MDVDMAEPQKTRGAVDPSIFHRLQENIDRDASFKDEIREITKELDRINRQITFVLAQCHSTPANEMPDALRPCKDLFAAQKSKITALASKASTMPYYKYNGLFSNQLQNASFSAVFSHWLGYDQANDAATPPGSLLTLEEVGEALGVKVNVGDEDVFHFTTEEYLHSLITLINEMSRLAVNSVTIGEYARPLTISVFLKELFSAFQILNLKNDSLRRRYDSIKYDVKKVEEVVYDLSLRGLLPNSSSGTEGHPATETAAPASSSSSFLKVKKLTETAHLPTRGSDHAAGYDMYASAPCTIPPGGRALVATGLSIAVPTDCYARIAPRSGLAVKQGIQTGAGVVDSDYRGEVRVLLFNQGDQEFHVQVGDRVAQMVLERVYTPVVEATEDLEQSLRGSGGFGSTGK